MFVRARIEEGVSDNAYLVPQVGVTHNPTGQATAMVVGHDNKVAVRTLSLGGTRGSD
jgi:membrane fusion protein (multidrug efflux system)